MENSVSMTTAGRETASITGRLVWRALSVESELRVSLNLSTVCVKWNLSVKHYFGNYLHVLPRRFSQFRGHLLHTQHYTGTQKCHCYRDFLHFGGFQ